MMPFAQMTAARNDCHIGRMQLALPTP